MILLKKFVVLLAGKVNSLLSICILSIFSFTIFLLALSSCTFDPNWDIKTSPDDHEEIQKGFIIVEPGLEVEAGEEVLFDASGYLADQSLLEGKFEWDFGDGYTLMEGYPTPYTANGGVGCTHYYMQPGTYTVTLTVTDIDGHKDTAHTRIDVVGKDTITITQSAHKILELKFENNLEDTSGNGLDGKWRNGEGSFIRGKEGQALDLSSGAYVEVEDPAGTLGGMDEFTVTFWAQKKEPDAYGYFIEKYPSYSVYISERTLASYFETEQGRVKTSDFIFYGADNTLWHHYAMVYDGSYIRFYVDNVETVQEGTDKFPRALTGTVVNSINSFLIGKSYSGTEIFNGYIDEIKVYNKALSQRDTFQAFELWHANFHGHIAQNIYAQIPGEINEDPANRLKVTITGDNGHHEVLLNKSNLGDEERFLLRNSELPKGSYYLVAQLLDDNNNVLDEVKEKFNKPYDGKPHIGINENNAICIDGEPFFPVTPWLLDKGHIPKWSGRYVNCLYAEGYYPEHTISAWTNYLDYASLYGLYTIGPERWDGRGPANFERNSNINKLAEYVVETRDHPALLMWMWKDEPDLGGRSAIVPGPVVSAWTYKSHQLDPHHLVAINGAGNYLPDASDTYKLAEYNYLLNADTFGGKKHFPWDVVGTDSYPLEYRNHPSYGGPDFVMENYAEAIDRMIGLNYNLVPAMSFIETQDIQASRDTPGPTPEQLRMEIWLNVVHGVKGINWFHYFEPVPDENFIAMEEFLDQVTRVAPIVLGPETERVVTDDADEYGNRVDTMVKEDEEYIWIFAVRITEIPEIDAPAIDVTFTIDGTASDEAMVFDEERTLNVTGGTFTDSFAPCDVHIYKIVKTQYE